MLLGSGAEVTTIEAPAGFDASTPTAYDYALADFTTERAIVHIGGEHSDQCVDEGIYGGWKVRWARACCGCGLQRDSCGEVHGGGDTEYREEHAAGRWCKHPGSCGLYNGRGIHVRGSGAVAVVDSNTVEEINRFHILINATDDIGALPAVFPQAMVRYNTITGKGSYGGGQKGIWFNTGAWGTISYNTISNMDYPNPVLEPDRASAIVVRFCYLDPAHRRIISNNIITASTHTNNKGMYLQGIGDSVVDNTITGFRWGIEVHDGANTKILRNTITGGRIGVLVQTQHAPGTPDSVTIGGSVADKNTITQAQEWVCHFVDL